MAALSAEAPDAKSFKSWEDAFKYPVPTVRKLQQQLRGDISSNRERLRTLVGGSYRELLGTADTIVAMDGQMQEVEAHLGETSVKCNTSRLGRSFRNQARLVAEKKEAESARFATASQLAVLQRCPEVLVRVVKRGGSVIQAAKILIIARRLYRKLAEAGAAPAYVERVWARLGRLRLKLLRIVDRRLASTRTETPALVDALCAYALAASGASATDVLRYFHKVRMDALANAIAEDEGGHEAVLESLRLWIKTLQDTRTIFPKQLAAALSKLKSAPLLKDEGIQSITEFDLDIHEPWLGEDLRNFMPYLRHDDLTIAAASQQLSAWAPMALKTLLSNVKQSLDNVEDLKKVDELRRGCLELLFSHYHVPGVRKDVVLGGFRETFENKLLELVKKRCEGLEGVADHVTQTITSWDAAFSAQKPASLWSDDLLSTETSRGGAAFTSAVQDALEGRTPLVKSASKSYLAWLSTVEDITTVIESMRHIKWEEHLDAYSDSDSDSDSETSRKQIQSLLKADDPAALDKAFARTLSSSVSTFVASVSESPSSFSSDPVTAQAQSAFVLRIIREAKRHPPPRHSASTLSFECAPRLHALLAKPPVDAALARNEAQVRRAVSRARPAGQALWEGEPPLPALPSPWLFRWLRDLEGELAYIGTDVWTPDAASVARAAAREALVHLLTQIVEGEGEGEGEGADAKGASANDARDDDEKKETAKDADDHDEGDKKVKGAGGPSREGAIQLIFDLEFLACSEGDQSEAGNAAKVLRARAKDLAKLREDDLNKLKGAAIRYRERTALLFALANGGD